jgi:outer membrane receptor for ferrienterochelin and colicins
LRIKASYSWQQTVDIHHHTLANAPRTLLKLNISGPLPGQRWHYGIAVRGASSRKTLRDDIGGYVVTDLTLRTPLSRQCELSASLYNLFDQRYYDPGSSEHVQDALEQDGRQFRVKLDYWF